MEMTRGEMQDLLNKFSTQNPKYREALLKDPKAVVERQFNMSLSGVSVKAVEEAADVLYIVVPRKTAAGELDDSDLEKVAGGGDINVKLGGSVNCQGATLSTMIQINLG
ncbi:MAG: NHLP leader peptide family RiPP precursor [Thermoanaerobaculia bacterium]|jgi:hypothetical protein